MARLTQTGYGVLGAAYWVAVTAFAVLALRLWPHLLDSETFFYAVLVAALAGGFAIAYFFKPRS